MASIDTLLSRYGARLRADGTIDMGDAQKHVTAMADAVEALESAYSNLPPALRDNYRFTLSLHGSKQEPVMPVSEVRALLEGLRDKIQAREQAAEVCAVDAPDLYHDGRASAHEADADLLTEALTTLPGSNR